MIFLKKETEKNELVKGQTCLFIFSSSLVTAGLMLLTSGMPWGKMPGGSLLKYPPVSEDGEFDLNFFLFPFCENSLICLEGKSMTHHRHCSHYGPPCSTLVLVSDP